MKEKEAIEKATAEGFLRLYNESVNETFRIKEHKDAPDIRCVNERNEALNLEITMTEDMPMDIASMLGRSNHRSIEALKKNIEDVQAAQASPMYSSLSGNVSSMLISRIIPKLNKDMGRNVALVIRDASPLDWNWEYVLEDIRAAIAPYNNPYDKGIWLVSYSKDKMYKIL
jgi:hypothetical protein